MMLMTITTTTIVAITILVVIAKPLRTGPDSLLLSQDPSQQRSGWG